MLVYASIHLTPVQNWLVQKVTRDISEELHTRVTVQYIDFAFFNKMVLKGLLVEDKHRDTLLYAGAANVSITDWFFLKQKPTLKYIGLDDATVNLKRTDSTWNYKFLADYFGGSKTKKDTSSSGLEFDIKILQLQNIHFNLIDQWVGQDMHGAVQKAALFADDIDMIKKQVNLNTLNLDSPSFSLSDYTGNRDKLNIVRDTSHTITAQSLYQWNEDGWIVNIKNLHLTNGVFKNDKETDRPVYTDHFDGLHLEFAHITGDMENVHFEKDTITTAVQLSARERSGFEIKKLQAKMKFTPEIMEFNDLDLTTNKSRLSNYYAMHYSDFTEDMSHFMHNVILEGNFTGSQIHSDDIAYFAPELKDWHRLFIVNGIAKGTVDNISAKKILIKSGNSFVDGEIALRGLPDIENTFIDFKANDLQTNFTELTTIAPSLKKVTQPDLSTLGKMHYKGSFTGFIYDFVAFGTINTNLGSVTGDINMKFPGKKPPVYLGKISTDGFALGRFVNTSEVGSISFDGKLNGSGFTTDELDANFDGNIHSIGFSGYNYQHITVKGDFRKKLFNGSVSIDDPNLQLQNLKGTMDFSNKIPRFNFDAVLAKADLKQLKLTADNYSLTGHFNLDFTGSNIDNFLGTAKIYNAVFLHNDHPLSFDSLTLQSLVIDNNKFLYLNSNELQANISGQFKILELPDAFKLFLNRYYPSYIKKPSYSIGDQHFSFFIKTKLIDDYVQLMDKKLKGFNNTTITGNLKLKENEFNINADVPEFTYDGKVFNTVKLEGKGNLDTLVAKINIADISINDSLHLPATNLNFSSHNDISNVSIATTTSQALSNASLNAQVKTMPQSATIHFFPSSFIINDKKWQLEKDGELTIGRSQVSANDIKFVQGNQEIIVSTEPSALYNSNDILIGLEKVSINEFVPYLFKDPKLDGILTGKIKIYDAFGKPYIEYEGKAEQFRYEADSVGVINTKGSFNSATGIVKVKADADNENYQFDMDGSFNSKDSTKNQTQIFLKTKKFNLSLLNNYLGSVFSDIQGVANTSDLKISGSTKDLSLTGTANINEGSLIVNYTQCRYKFTNENIIFNPNEIDFGTILLKDSLNNEGTLSGKIYHRFFNNFQFDNLRFETNNLLLLNTTKKDNGDFYGKVIGRASMVLNGPVTNMVMNIEGEPSESTADSNHIYLLSNSTAENGSIDYIDFIQFGSKMEENFKDKLSSSILVDMDLAANPACKIDVILDETTGDIIKGEGNGKLNIRVGNKEPLSIRGRYDITNGEYTFNFQTFLKKPFTLNSGSITWTGDPFLANIDIVAEYLAKKVDFSNISNNARQKSDVSVLARLTETLKKPKISFEFELPDYSELRNDFIVAKRLDEYRNDENEMNKQVTSLLLFNTFINNDQGFINAGSGYSVLSNTIGGVISNALSNSFNKILQKLLNDNTISTYVDINSSLELENKVAKLQGAGKLGITKTFFDNRLIISVGGNVDYSNTGATVTPTGRNNNLLLTPDITLEWILTKDGRLRIVGFNQTNADLIGQRNRTGIKLTYRKDFDKLSEMFNSSEAKARRKEAGINTSPILN